MAAFLSRPHDSRNCARHLFPLRLFGGKLFLAWRCEPIVLKFALQIFARRLPLRRDPSFPFETVKGWIERPVLDLQHVFPSPLNMLRDLMTMSRAKQQRAQDQHVQGSLQEFDVVW